MRTWCLAAILLGIGCAVAGRARAEPLLDGRAGVLELRFTPVRFAQLAIWLERPDGEFLATLRLTEAVALRGIGNRPGASEMNSGFRWPYGRREGALPIWATRRGAAPGAKPFRRVVYQKRLGEGLTSRTSDDFSPDDYFCLSFDQRLSTREALDAVTCASPFTSDKGRYITDADIAAGYAEPYEQPWTGHAFLRPLSYASLYPPRRDIVPCMRPSDGCFEHPDVASFAAHAREVMPDIDAVTMATPVGGVAQQILVPVRESWQPGAYRVCLEINVEGDYNAAFNDLTHPSPLGTGKGMEIWDAPVTGYGYPYRGQPSVLYCIDFAIGGGMEQAYATNVPAGSAGTWDLTDPSYGAVRPMDGLTDDPWNAPGSGADRLLSRQGAQRFEVRVKPGAACSGDQLPSPVEGLSVAAYPDRSHAHERIRLRFLAASDDRGIVRYEVRVASAPIVDEVSFIHATPAKEATVEAAELLVPTGVAAGQPIEVDTGGLTERSHYYVAVRAIDGCAGQGPIRSVEVDTPVRVFATVSPCFIATAAFGTPLAREIGALRRWRDRYLASHAVGRVVLSAYESWGPHFAQQLRGHDRVRAAVRAALAPLIALARWLDG